LKYEPLEQSGMVAKGLWMQFGRIAFLFAIHPETKQHIKGVSYKGGLWKESNAQA